MYFTNKSREYHKNCDTVKPQKMLVFFAGYAQILPDASSSDAILTYFKIVYFMIESIISKSFWLGRVLKHDEEEGHLLLNELIIHNSICIAAPGFTQDC